MNLPRNPIARWKNIENGNVDPKQFMDSRPIMGLHSSGLLKLLFPEYADEIDNLERSLACGCFGCVFGALQNDHKWLNWEYIKPNKQSVY